MHGVLGHSDGAGKADGVPFFLGADVEQADGFALLDSGGGFCRGDLHLLVFGVAFADVAQYFGGVEIVALAERRQGFVGLEGATVATADVIFSE